jgi:hypothetical protein
MILAAKVALGIGGTMVLACAYTFRQGVFRVDVDENRHGGSHVHFLAPATVIPMAVHLVPKECLRDAGAEAGQWMPLMHSLSKELAKYPNTEFVEVQDGDQHVRVRTHNGKLQIDVDAPDEHVHVVCPSPPSRMLLRN